jgi:hypothetical protein
MPRRHGHWAPVRAKYQGATSDATAKKTARLLARETERMIGAEELARLDEIARRAREARRHG